MNKRSIGIIETVLGGVAGIWAYVRATNLTGQMHTWSLPFTTYETVTVIGGGIGVVLLILGLIALTQKDGPAA